MLQILLYKFILNTTQVFIYLCIKNRIFYNKKFMLTIYKIYVVYFMLNV